MRKLKRDLNSIVTNGKFNFGNSNKPPQRINPLDADINPKIPTIKLYKYMRLKEWHAFQLGNDRFFIFIALMNLKKATCLLVNLFDKVENKKYFYDKKLPLSAIKLPDNLMYSQVVFDSKDFKISVFDRLKENRIKIELDLSAKNDLPDLKAEFIAITDNCDPIVSCIPFGKNRGVYAFKGNYPMTGYVYLDDNRFKFDSSSSFFIIDDQKGYYPYIMKWDWITASGYVNNKLIGFNFTTNQSTDINEFNENCIWINGKLHLLPPVKFVRDKNCNPEKWIIKDENGLVDLTFEIKVYNQVNENFIIIKSKYTAPFGIFNGFIKTESGEFVEIKDMFGMGEDYYVRC